MKKIAVLGYGGRGRMYSDLCLRMKDKFEVVSVIDTSADKLAVAKDRTKLTDDKLFDCLDDFLSANIKCDYVFICTQDKEHYEHTIKVIDAGYNALLEKPIACSVEDCIAIEKAAEAKGVKVAVCHVLRYSKYYEKIKQVIDSGILGKVVAIEQVENVAYWHQAHSFVRGDWRRKDESNPMIIAKCCHDLDIAVYLADSKCKYVSSIGKNHYFNKLNAPAGATEYCVGGCKAKENCPYDAEKLYIKRAKKMPKAIRGGMWPQSRLMSDGYVTIPKLEKAIRETRYGKCVFLSDNDVVDYQTTVMEFENGIQSTLTMTAFSNDGYSRETRIRGTLGELICDMGKNKMMLEIFGKRGKNIAKGLGFDAHGGGDLRLIKGLADDELKTDIAMSIESHIIAFAAEESRLNNGESIDLDKYRAEHTK